MRWPAAIGIGAVCAIVGCVLGFALGDVITRAYKVSDFEGGRGYAVVFLFVPAGMFLSLAIGIAVARASHGTGAGGFFKAQGIALLASAGTLGALSGIALLLADRAPKIGGKALQLEFEIRIPTDQPVPDDLKTASLTASFYENKDNNRFADLAFDKVTRDSGFVTVPGTAYIGGHSTYRMLSAYLGGGESHVFEIRISPGPVARDMEWSGWEKTRDPLGANESRTGERWQVRYRVAPLPPPA